VAPKKTRASEGTLAAVRVFVAAVLFVLVSVAAGCWVTVSAIFDFSQEKLRAGAQG
jgi:hypothetical protein